MRNINLYGFAGLMLLTGCSWNVDTFNARVKQYEKTNCVNQPEFSVEWVVFKGFNHSELEKINIVESDPSGLTTKNIAFELQNTPYEFNAAEGTFALTIPKMVFNTRNSYDFTLNNDVIYQLHDMNKTAKAYTMDAEEWWCEMTEYSINDRSYSDMNSNGIYIEK